MRWWVVGWVGRLVERRKEEAGRLVEKGAGPRQGESREPRILRHSHC